MEHSSEWNIRSFLNKLKIKLPFDPAIPLLGTDLKEINLLSLRNDYTAMFIAALFTVARIWKEYKGLSTDE